MTDDKLIPDPTPTIPAHIANNIMQLLHRVKLEGQEALAWVEAYTWLQPHAAKMQPPQSVPFQPGPPKASA